MSSIHFSIVSTTYTIDATPLTLVLTTENDYLNYAEDALTVVTTEPAEGDHTLFTHFPRYV